eukprot:g32543.t1
MGLVEVVKEIPKEVEELQESVQPSHGLDSKIVPDFYKSFTSEGIQFVLGNDRAGSKVGVMPLVLEKPKENQGTKELKEKYPGIILDRMATRSHSHKLKQDGKIKQKDKGVEVQLGDTLFDEMVKEEPKQVQKEVEVMLQEDIVELSQSMWSSPIVLVPNPDSTQRFCVDYWNVNAITKSDSYPIPRLEDCMENVGQATYITKMDLLHSYWQVPFVREKAKDVSVFVTPNGLYLFKVMVFGMKNAPATFQRLMNRVVLVLTNCPVRI